MEDWKQKLTDLGFSFDDTLKLVGQVAQLSYGTDITLDEAVDKVIGVIKELECEK